MKPKIVIWLLCIAAVLAWMGMAGAQAAPPAPKVQLPSGEAEWRLEGLWETADENYGEYAQYGSYPNVYQTRQNGSAFSAH
jgi:hypothetical protein